MKDINDLLLSAPAWIILFAIAGYIFQTFSLAPFLRWLANRRREQLVFINTQLKDAIDLSPKMREHLLRRRDRLILLTTVGVAVEPDLGEVLIALCEDPSSEIEWSDLDLTDEFLVLGPNDKVSVRIGWFKGLWKILSLLPCVVCSVYYFYFAFAVIAALTPSANTAVLDFSEVIRNATLAFIFLIGVGGFWYPFWQIFIAWRVSRRLKRYQATRNTSKTLPRQVTPNTKVLHRVELHPIDTNGKVTEPAPGSND